MRGRRPEVIVGAGAAGLSLALLTGMAVYESDDVAGGLCRSRHVDGFTFDTGPHILGGIPEAVAWIRESTGLRFLEGTTRNVGWHEGRYVDHPFTDPDLGLAYMGKMWKADPRTLSLPALGAQAGRKPGGVTRWLYPASGGYQAITDAWAARVEVTYRTEITERAGTVWTAPLPDGRYNTLVTVTQGYRGTAPELTAVYVPGDWTPFHRLSFPAAFSPANAPVGAYAIQGEISLAPGSLVALSGEFDRAVGTLELASGEPLFSDVAVIPHAYPVPVVEPSFRGHGRTGGFRYLNLDGVVAASMALHG